MSGLPQGRIGVLPRDRCRCPAVHVDYGYRATLQQGCPASDLHFAFIGLPAHGEDSGLLARLNSIAARRLPQSKFRCGNDMVCGWAGALGGSDGINIVAGTGSIAYGEFGPDRPAPVAGASCSVRGFRLLDCAGGTDSLLAYERWARAPRPVVHLMRDRFQLREDLALCAVCMGRPP